MLCFVPIVVLILLFGIYLNVSLSTTSQNHSGSTTTIRDFGASIETTDTSLGLRLQLSENSSIIPSQDAINFSFSLWNTLPYPNNVTTSSNWAVQGLAAGPCRNFYTPIGIAVYRGYYHGNNISSASPLPVWAAVECIVGMPINYSSYSLLPDSDSGNYEAFYLAYQSQQVSTGWFPVTLSDYAVIYAANQDFGFNTLGSSQASVYTVAVGDEWGQLAELHFQVVPSNNLPIVGNFLAAPYHGSFCSENGNPIPCNTDEFSDALILNCGSQAATATGCTVQYSFQITAWYPYVGQAGEPASANCKFVIPSDSEYSPGYGQCISVNSTAFAISPM
jgi:hypothetical protein